MPTDAPWNRPIARWRQAGAIFLWRYEENVRNDPGWHLTADAGDRAGGAQRLR